jgi:hypothetical protein
MSLASEDKQQLRDIARAQQTTNKLLAEIRDLLKSPPERISGKPDINEILLNADRLTFSDEFPQEKRP